MWFIRVLSLICLFTANTRASNHWIVTEAGLIQSKEESPFLLAKPFDLLSFLNQEIRWQNTFNIYNDLLLRQNMINTLWTELEQQSDFVSHMEKNDHCKGVKENMDWFASVMEDGRGVGIQEKEYMHHYIEQSGNTDVPDCKKISSLTYSMATFEHLEGVRNRGYLNVTSETTRPATLTSIRPDSQYGHWLTDMLRKNTTSWLHYNLAAIYWRLKGNGPKALECSRRAVHYAPRHYKTVPLLCMGSILHRSKQTEDAIIVLGASVDHSPTLPLGHFALAGAYAVSGDYNSSLKHLNISINYRVSPSEKMEKIRSAVLCHRDMFTKMESAQNTLSRLSAEIKEFRQIGTEWFEIHAALLHTMKHKEKYNHINIETNCIKMEEITQLKIKELQQDADRNTLIEYLVTNPLYAKVWKTEKGVIALQFAYSFQKALKRTVKQTGPPNQNLMSLVSPYGTNRTEILKEIGPMPVFPDMFSENLKFSDKAKKAKLIKNAESKNPESTENLEQDTTNEGDRKVLYPPNMVVNRNKHAFDTDPEWPSTDFCQAAKANFPETMDTVYPVFLPFENKGISLQSLLTDRIGVSAFEEHELPWHPPLCPNDKDTPMYTSKKGIKVQLAPEAAVAEYLRYKLLMYVSHEHCDEIENKQDAEIGQRIHTAMQKKLASKWILYTLASLYWRVRGNSANAINCLSTAQRSADAKYRDIVLVSLGSVFLEMGLWDDALATAEEAYKLNPYEPPTNFLLAQIHMVKKHQKAQFFHIKQALRVDPQYLYGRAQSLLNCWACIFKQVNTLRELGVISADIEAEKDICAETEAGVSMVCAKDGSNCREAKQCNPGISRESSALARMLEDKEASDHYALFTHKVLEATFNKVLSTRPSERHDKAGHLRSYDQMMRPVSEQMSWCKHNGCWLTPEALEIKREECGFNMFESHYWLHFVSFQIELDDEELKLATELNMITPSHKRIPECRVPPDATSDFFLSRILTVDSDEWGALLGLMQQLIDMFLQPDYALLGSKLAKYVDTHGSNWWGALVAGWWCGAIGRGVCAVKCLAVAHSLAPPHLAQLPLRPLIALLHMQKKKRDATDIAYLSFYMAPRSKTEAFLVAMSHYYNDDTDDAIWMFRYALSLDVNYVPATACLHRAMCQLAFGKDFGKMPHQTST